MVAKKVCQKGAPGSLGATGSLLPVPGLENARADKPPVAPGGPVAPGRIPTVVSRPCSHAQARTGPTPSGAIIVALGGALSGSAFLTAHAGQAGVPFWVGWLALAPFFAAIRSLRPILAMLCGALWGASLFVFTGGGSGPGNPIVVGLLLTVIPAAYAYLAARVTRWIGFSPFVLGVGWMGVELALAPLGLHSGLLAGTQDQTALMDYMGRALGYVLVAFLVAYVNAALVAVFARVRLRLPRPFRITTSGNGVLFLRSQIVGRLSLVALQPSHPRAPPF